jgi:hypothetical protein
MPGMQDLLLPTRADFWNAGRRMPGMQDLLLPTRADFWNAGRPSPAIRSPSSFWGFLMSSWRWRVRRSAYLLTGLALWAGFVSVLWMLCR